MRILYLAHRIPYPPNKGEKIRSFNILKYLAARHEVYVATLVDDAADAGGATGLRNHAHEVLVERIDQPGRRLRSSLALLSGRPITLRYFYSRRLQSGIDTLLTRVQIDAVFCSSSPMAEYVFRSNHASGRLQAARLYMDLIDVDSYKWQQYAARSPFWSAWVYRREARLLSAYERRIAAEFAHLFVVSEQERACFPGGATSNLLAMANGVDLAYFSPAPPASSASGGPKVVFTGVMDYWPNVDGVCWFVESVWPRVRDAVPAARLYIVGSRPGPAVKRLANEPGVRVTGHVEDVREYVGDANVCIAPLRLARGIQNKVLEAMAMARPVVVTPEAHEGVRAVDGRDILVARGEAAFAAAIVLLLQDGDAARSIGSNARLCVEANYDWEQNLARLGEVGL